MLVIAMTELRGVLPILSTPFDEAGALDEASLRTLVRREVEAGVHGLTILGIAGEVYKLLDAKTGKLPKWNFGKYVVSRDGKHAEFFDSKVTPESTELREAIDRALAAK